MIINLNTITSNFNRTKIALGAGAHQGGLQALRACRATTYIADLALRKTIKAPFLLKNLFSKKNIIKDSSSPAQQEVILDPLQSPNPLIQDISESFKETVVLYKNFTNKSGDLTEKAVNQVGHLLEKTINKKPSLEDIPSLDRVDFGKLLDSPLRVTQKLFPKEFLNLTGRNESEKEITAELKSLVACLQRLKIPYELAETFTPSGIDSINKQLKLINKDIEDFRKKKANHPANVCRMLINAHSSINKLQILLEKYQKDINRPIEEEDRIFAKNIIKNNPLITKVVSPTVIALGSVATPFITIDCVPHIASNAIGLLTNAVHVFQENAFPVLQNATITTASCALAAVSYTDEEEQESIPRYMINALANQVLTCAFAYVGARMCGSKTKVKEFVEQRISSVLAYKICNYRLDYLGFSFWSNKVCSSTVSSCTNHLLNLFTEEDPT
ncbi:MAG TPA: hypothetical protein VGZ69_06580 [Candidatus Rhabdochlamydia sp.]|jgi:hypothetical protein|nr:hypothetical protein [Candidatus Rhabdochlamydia sp.]